MPARGVKWPSLDSLLLSVKTDGGLKPPGRITAIAHSAGVFIVMRWLGDGRLAHVVVLDAAARRARWYGGAPDRRLTLIGAESVHARTPALGKRLGCAPLADPTVAYPAAERCVAAVDGASAHMDVVWNGGVIPRGGSTQHFKRTMANKSGKTTPAFAEKK